MKKQMFVLLSFLFTIALVAGCEPMGGKEKVSITEVAVPTAEGIRVARDTRVSGTTASGKSNTARVVVENFILLEQTPVLIFDNTLQWSGLGKANRSEAALKRFDQLGIGRKLIRPFDIRIYTSRSPSV